MSPKVSESYKWEKRKEILQAARQVFIKEGFTDATMQDIIDKARISRGALYAYFDNIEHVFIEVLQFDDQEELLLFEQNGDTFSWPHIKKWVLDQQIKIEATHQTLVLAKAEFFLSSKYVKNKDRFPYITERYERIVEATKVVIEKGVERGEFKSRQSPESIAGFLISFLDGLMLNTFQLGPDRTNVSDQLSAILFSLEAMLCPVEEK
ncbi:TetR family transcriptional regulator [Alteribacter populi]|uniref:TetR family transcriptional regulator n=1 Tax=Alteribacter populi TaxID=2011011 RepID=UPI000BBA6902|nr:TetR family transcriptional regulator [Alteribacter populi]